MYAASGEILTTSPVWGAWMNFPSPMYIPTCPGPYGSGSKKTRSPGARNEGSTGAPSCTCVPVKCVSETPSLPYTYCIRPEQSNPTSGDAPPQTYGVPRYCSASSTACQPIGLAPPKVRDTSGSGVLFMFVRSGGPENPSVAQRPHLGCFGSTAGLAMLETSAGAAGCFGAAASG